MDINFEYYKIFYYVAKYKNITKAAIALGSSQPNVTRVMKLLEAQLNCRLFIRGARGVGLTEEGEKLYAHVEIAFQHLSDAEEEISLHESKWTGTVEIGVTEAALNLFLMDAMGEFRTRYPKIRIRIHNRTTPELISRLNGGSLDFAMLTTPFEMARPCQIVELFAFQEILVGGPSYSHFAGKTMELTQLTAYPWIGLGRESTTYEFYKDFFITHNLDIELDMEVATSGTMIPLIQHNLGIGFVPEALAAPLLKRKKLVKLDLGICPPLRFVDLVCETERRKSTAAEKFYQYLLQRSSVLTSKAGKDEKP